MSTILAMLLAVVLLAANGFFVAAEFALLAARRSRIQAQADAGSGAARSALRGLRELSLMLAAAQLGITMCSLGLGVIAEPAIAHLLEDVLHVAGIPQGLDHVIAFTVALSFIVFLLMVVGEMAPKSWAISHPEDSALLLARPFRGFAWLFRPIIWLLNVVANGVVRLCRVEPQAELAMAHSPQDLALLLDESARRGLLEVEDSALLRRTLDLSRLRVRDVMIPRERVVAVAADAPVEEVERVAHGSRRARLLVHRGSLDDLLGVVFARELLLLDDEQRATMTAGALVREPLVTRSDRAVEELVAEMRSAGEHLAVVRTPDGRVEGVLTVEDVFEEIVGELDRTAPTRR
jgi:CBS domain containing-hemolysin-like protein